MATYFLFFLLFPFIHTTLLAHTWRSVTFQKKVFEENGVIVRISDVIALAVGHRPGGLADILDVLDDANLNIEYMYGFSQRIGLAKQGRDIADSAVIVFRFNDPDAACDALQKRDIRVLGSEELFG